MKPPWVYVENLEDPVPSPEELKHLRVRRVKDGSSVVAFDGSGVAILGVFKGGRIEPRKRLCIRPNPPVFVPVFPLLKSQKMDFFFRVLPMFDVEEVVIFVPERGEVKKAPSSEKLSRWEKVMIASCKQCMNPYLPGVRVRPLKDIEPGDGESAILLDEGEMERGLEEGMVKEKKRVYVASGPEGGFSPEEKEVLMSKGFIPVTLGLRVFPSELSVFVFLSMASFLKGTASKIPQDEREFFLLSRHRD